MVITLIVAEGRAVVADSAFLSDFVAELVRWHEGLSCRAWVRTLAAAGVIW
jgi:hypothetical protein